MTSLCLGHQLRLAKQLSKKLLLNLNTSTRSGGLLFDKVIKNLQKLGREHFNAAWEMPTATRVGILQRTWMREHMMLPFRKIAT